VKISPPSKPGPAHLRRPGREMGSRRSSETAWCRGAPAIPPTAGPVRAWFSLVSLQHVDLIVSIALMPAPRAAAVELLLKLGRESEAAARREEAHALAARNAAYTGVAVRPLPSIARRHAT
jgi:hypothetical protein